MNKAQIQLNNQELAYRHLEILKTLQASSGLFLASSKDVSTGYNKAWLRDNFYTSLAFEKAGDWETVRRLWRALLDIFLKHKDKISWAVENRPHESCNIFMPAITLKHLKNFGKNGAISKTML